MTNYTKGYVIQCSYCGKELQYKQEICACIISDLKTENLKLRGENNIFKESLKYLIEIAEDMATNEGWKKDELTAIQNRIIELSVLESSIKNKLEE